MENEKSADKMLETIAWGALLIWWGLRWWPLISLPEGSGLLGTAVILLGLNLVRSLKGIPARSFTTILGGLALLWGGTELADSVLRLPFKIPVFELSLITLGVYLLVRELLRSRQANPGVIG